jgi:hypothetical protein
MNEVDKIRGKLLNLVKEDTDLGRFTQELVEKIVDLYSEVDKYKTQSLMNARSLAFEKLDIPKNTRVLNIKFEDESPISHESARHLLDGLKKQYIDIEHILITPKSVDITTISKEEWKKFNLVSKKDYDHLLLKYEHLDWAYSDLKAERDQIRDLSIKIRDDLYAENRTLSIELRKYQYSQKDRFLCKLKTRLSYYYYWVCRLFS